MRSTDDSNHRRCPEFGRFRSIELFLSFSSWYQSVLPPSGMVARVRIRTGNHSVFLFAAKEYRIAKQRNTFAKRQREQDQRQRSEVKRLKRVRKSVAKGDAKTAVETPKDDSGD